jgi:hypothetical protein
MGSEESKAGRKKSYGEKTSTVAFRVPDSKLGFVRHLINRFLSKWQKEYKDGKG